MPEILLPINDGFEAFTLNIMGHCKHDIPQINRIDDLGETLRYIKPRFAVINEGESRYNIENLAFNAEMVVLEWAFSAKDPDEITAIFCRPDEKIKESGMVPLDLKGDRKGVFALTEDDIAIGGLQCSYKIFKDMFTRTREILMMIKALSEYDKALILGDFNAEPWMKSRDHLVLLDYTSCQDLSGYGKTFPNPDYKHTIHSIQAFLTSIYPCSLDDIYGRGVSLSNTRLVAANTDHFGVATWVTAPHSEQLSTLTAGNVDKFATISSGLLVPTSA